MSEKVSRLYLREFDTEEEYQSALAGLAPPTTSDRLPPWDRDLSDALFPPPKPRSSGSDELSPLGIVSAVRPRYRLILAPGLVYWSVFDPPGWFHRLMTRLLLGWRYERLSAPAKRYEGCTHKGQCPSYGPDSTVPHSPVDGRVL